MHSIQTGTAAYESPAGLQAGGMRPASPTSHYGKRSLALLTGPATTSAGAQNTTPLSSQHQQTAPRDTVEHQEPKRFCSLPDLGSPHLNINSPIPNWTPPQELTERPTSTPTLEKDEALTGSLQEIESLSDIKKRLAERSSVERLNGEYKFDLLMPSLRNMRTFISHIREGHQFPEPLTAEEQETLAWLAQKTQALLDAGAPYKRTVYMATALMVLCEIITERQILDPLRSAEAQDSGKPWQHLDSSSLYDCMDPTIIMKSYWGEDTPEGLTAHKDFIGKYVHGFGLDQLPLCIDDERLFVFPSFQPLTLDDFCYFGHLPVHPVGMITTYAVKVHQRFMSPLQFAMHDMGHMCFQKELGAPRQPPLTPGDFVLSSPDKRLEMRCLLLDQLPAGLVPLMRDPALRLLLFHFFHERNLSISAAVLKYSQPAFLFSLATLARARREQRTDYPEEYQSLTDAEAARAVLWTLSLWRCWQAANFHPLTPKQQQACTRHFEQAELPRLNKHLEFIERHRILLRQLFADRHCIRVGEGTPSDHFRIQSRELEHEICHPIQILLQAWHEPSGLCNLDNTDLFYFHALNVPALRGQMESVTGASLPDEILDMTDCPPPMQAAALLEEPDTTVA